MLNLPELKAVQSNITTIRLMASEDVEDMNILDQWKRLNYLTAEQYRYAQQIFSPNRLTVCIYIFLFIFFSYLNICWNITDLFSQIEAALSADVITVISRALQEKKLFQRINEPKTRCDLIDTGMTQYWKEGRELLHNIDVSLHFRVA